jgi:DNA polymerase III delta prime subunit
MNERIVLDPTIKSSEAQDFENKLFARVGSGTGSSTHFSLYQIYLSEMASPGRPIGNLLFLGPTGSGKTRVVEAAAEILFGDSKAAIQIDRVSA